MTIEYQRKEWHLMAEDYPQVAHHLRTGDTHWVPEIQRDMPSRGFRQDTMNQQNSKRLLGTKECQD
jgi:hypothetical protein